MQAYSASLRGKFASQTLPPPYECYLICSAYPMAVCFSVSKPDHPHSRTSVATYLPSADRTRSIIHTPVAIYFHFSAGESVYHKNRRWRSSPTVFFIRKRTILILLFALYLGSYTLRSKTLQGSFLLSFFSKKRNRVLRIPPRPRAFSLTARKRRRGRGIPGIFRRNT